MHVVLQRAFLFVPGITRAVSLEPARDVVTAVSNAWDGVPVSSCAYASDALGRRTARTDTSAGLQSGNAFGYNARSELVEATMDSSAYAYAYDPIGNREWAALNAATNLYAADALNLYGEIQATAGGIPSAPALTPSYDADGNLTALGPWTYAWDAENRLVSACSNDALLVVNTYDHQSRRIRKEVFDVSNNCKLKTVNYLWDGWNIFREVLDTATLSVTNYYTWGPDLSGTMQGAGGVGGLVAVTTVSSGAPPPVLHFPCCDANGNITGYVAGDGTVAARYAYDAFGNVTAESGPLADTFTHRFSTKPFDAETGLVMFQLRPYDPPTGRFIGRDPIEEAGGLNLHGFVGNDSINKIDTLGLSVKPTVLEEILATIGAVLFGGRIMDEAAFLYYGGREKFIKATSRELYLRGTLAGKMWDRAVSGEFPSGTMHGDLLKIDESNQSTWGNAVDVIKESAAYKDRVQFIQRRIREGTSPNGHINIEFNSPSTLASSIHGAQIHYKCYKCELVLTIQDEYNFDRGHMWRRLQQEGYIIPYNVIVLMPTETCEVGK